MKFENPKTHLLSLIWGHTCEGSPTSETGFVGTEEYLHSRADGYQRCAPVHFLCPLREHLPAIRSDVAVYQRDIGYQSTFMPLASIMARSSSISIFPSSMAFLIPGPKDIIGCMFGFSAADLRISSSGAQPRLHMRLLLL